MLQKGQYVDEAMVVYVYDLGATWVEVLGIMKEIYINRGRNFSLSNPMSDQQNVCYPLISCYLQST